MTEGGPASKVVVGVDGSKSGQEALEWARRYVGAMGGRLTAVIAWQYPPNASGAALTLPKAFGPEGDARTTLSQAIAQAQGGGASDIDEVVVLGNAAAVLIDQSHDADLLVVGTRGHGGFAGMLLGSVSTHCVHHAHCPVVVVRS